MIDFVYPPSPAGLSLNPLPTSGIAFHRQKELFLEQCYTGIQRGHFVRQGWKTLGCFVKQPAREGTLISCACAGYLAFAQAIAHFRLVSCFKDPYLGK